MFICIKMQFKKSKEIGISNLHGHGKQNLHTTVSFIHGDAFWDLPTQHENTDGSSIYAIVFPTSLIKFNLQIKHNKKLEKQNETIVTVWNYIKLRNYFFLEFSILHLHTSIDCGKFKYQKQKNTDLGIIIVILPMYMLRSNSFFCNSG